MGKAQEAKVVEKAIRLNQRGRYEAAIDHLRQHSIPMQFGWFVRVTRPPDVWCSPMTAQFCEKCRINIPNTDWQKHLAYRHGADFPPHTRMKCPCNCGDEIYISECLLHLQEKHPAEYTLATRFSRRDGRKQHVWGAGKYKLSDVSGGIRTRVRRIACEPTFAAKFFDAGDDQTPQPEFDSCSAVPPRNPDLRFSRFLRFLRFEK